MKGRGGQRHRRAGDGSPRLSMGRKGLRNSVSLDKALSRERERGEGQGRLLEGGGGSREATLAPLGGHQAVKMHGQSRGHRTGATTPVPHVDFLKMNMNSKASKPIANFNVIGSLKKFPTTPISCPWSCRRRLHSLAANWRPLHRASLPPFLSLPLSLLSLLSFLLRTTQSCGGHR